MRKKIVIISFIIILSILTFSFKLFNDLKIESNLQNELNELTTLINNKNLQNQEKIQEKLTTYISKNDYLIVEKAYKSYLLDIFQESLIIKDLLNDKRITTILTPENILNDIDFQESKKFLTKTKESLNTSIAKLINLLDENKRLSYLDKDIGDYYLNFYKKISFNENFKKSKESLEKTLNTYNNIFSAYEEAINFLTENKNNYKIKDSLIYFKNKELNESYNNIISKLN
ncbi:MAG: hypothetical protein IJ501_06345 [Bacilli bacterium]|nr:hypothetical protein [Bacilli bacterium]